MHLYEIEIKKLDDELKNYIDQAQDNINKNIEEKIDHDYSYNEELDFHPSINDKIKQCYFYINNDIKAKNKYTDKNLDLIFKNILNRMSLMYNLCFILKIKKMNKNTILPSFFNQFFNSETKKDFAINVYATFKGDVDDLTKTVSTFAPDFLEGDTFVFFINTIFEEFYKKKTKEFETQISNYMYKFFMFICCFYLPDSKTEELEIEIPFLKK